MTAAIGFLGSISIDCPDPDALAPFYRGLLGLDEAFATPDRGVVSLSGAGPMVTLMRVDEYVAPSWPNGPQKQQMHLDVGVDDLDTAVAAAIELGAAEAAHQTAPDRWRVLLDPVGHPFCLSTVRPD
ncbi:VOC family protein [Mycobacterium deserti]|uniref:VOC family protein n=1 Tax=Mycobacterium deserti TaxID=2978347 RepID=A0ABT2MG23_9MYCO|nr:VOC family protein [Mycobacterium deserti]MCT7660474.1 VOC family protein [Mycobacterium deserti]